MKVLGQDNIARKFQPPASNLDEDWHSLAWDASPKVPQLSALLQPPCPHHVTPQCPYFPFNCFLMLKWPLCCFPHLIGQRLDFVHEHVSRTWHRAWHLEGTQEMFVKWQRSFLWQCSLLPSWRAKGMHLCPRQELPPSPCLQRKGGVSTWWTSSQDAALSCLLCYLVSCCLALTAQQR